MNTPRPELTPVRAGEVLAGKYRVERVLGVGGMGVVVAAHHLQLDQKVALKFLLPEALARAEVVARFDREARASARIRSEHVARVIDVGKLESGAPYMVMEYLEGGDLAAWLEHRGVLPVEQAVEFVLQACEAVAEAHALGIVHRDLKPANLFCVRRPDGSLSIKVLDFGISKISGLSASGDMAMTRTAAIVGSPFYMSPEQMHSAKGVDARTDIWALGVILYELLTDRVPFEADEVPALILKVLRDVPAPLTSLRRDVPPGLDAVVRRCLEKDRGQRYADVGALVRALVEFAPARARLSLDVVNGIQASVPGAAFSLEAPPSHRPSLPAPRAPTAASWGGTGAEAIASTRPSPRRWLLAGAVAGGLGLAAATGAVVRGAVHAVRPAPPADTGALPSVRANEPLPDAALLPAVDADTPREEAGVAAREALDAAAHAVRDGGPSKWTPPSPWPPVTTATAATTGAPSVNCNPPYFYDARGNKVFKLGCLP
jgi:serine/threonine protein kinase